MRHTRATRQAIATVVGLLVGCGKEPTVVPTPAPPVTPLAPQPYAPPIMPNTPLGAPADIGVVALGTEVEITWTDESSAEKGFHIQRSAGPGGPWSTIGTAVSNAEEFFDGVWPVEQRYCYRVIAFNDGGESAPSSARCVVPLAAPTDLAATVATGPVITLAWSPHSPSAKGYRISRAVSPTELMPYATASATLYRDSHVQYGKSYMYSVQAVSDDGSSGPSNVVTVALSQSPPAPVTNLTAYAASFSVAISWQDHVTDESGSRVERSLDGVSGWAAVATVLAGYTEAADTDSKIVNPEHRYCYRVVQFNSSGDGPSSNVACTTTIAAPTNFQATRIAGDSIAFTWTDNSRIETGYQILVGGSLEGEGWLADLPANSQSVHLPMQPIFTNPTSVFYVEAYTETGTSDASNVVQFGAASGRVIARVRRSGSR